MESWRFRWSTEDMSLGQFVEKYRSSLPKTLLTTCGYMDVDNMNEVSADQIYWVYDIYCQRRVIAKTEDLRYVSIPLNYSLQFQKLTRRNERPGPSMRLDEIVGDDVPAGQRIRLAAGSSVLFDFGTDGIGECNAQLGVLELQDVYTEKYLLAYTANEDEWVSEVVGLPAYLPIRVKVAMNATDADDITAFKQWKQQQTEMCSPDFTPCKEILLFEQPPKGNYEYVNPCKYARSETATEPRNDLDDLDDDDFDDDDDDDSDSDSGYERIPPIANQPSAASSKQLPATQTASAKPSIPPKQWRSFDNDNKRNSKTTAISEPCSSRPNVIQGIKTTTLPATRPPVNQMPSKAVDNLVYEVIDALPNPTGGAAESRATKRGQSGSDVTKTSQHHADPLYSVPHLAAVSKKKQPPPTKPKSFKSKPVVAADAEGRTAVVNPVKSTADCDEASPEHGKKYWKSARDVPADLTDLNVEQIGECMELLHLPRLASAFRSQDVDGKLLMSIVSEELLMNDFSCRVFDAKKVVQFVKNGWRPN